MDEIKDYELLEATWVNDERYDKLKEQYVDYVEKNKILPFFATQGINALTHACNVLIKYCKGNYEAKEVLNILTDFVYMKVALLDTDCRDEDKDYFLHDYGSHFFKEINKVPFETKTFENCESLREFLKELVKK